MWADGCGGGGRSSEWTLAPGRSVKRGRSVVREGRTVAAKWSLEGRWKDGPGEERDLWQGLAQLCVGLTHAARGNSAGALRLLERGAVRLEEYDSGDGSTYGLDLTAVVACAREHSITDH